MLKRIGAPPRGGAPAGDVSWRSGRSASGGVLSLRRGGRCTRLRALLHRRTAAAPLLLSCLALRRSRYLRLAKHPKGTGAALWAVARLHAPAGAVLRQHYFPAHGSSGALLSVTPATSSRAGLCPVARLHAPAGAVARLRGRKNKAMRSGPRAQSRSASGSAPPLLRSGPKFLSLLSRGSFGSAERTTEPPGVLLPQSAKVAHVCSGSSDALLQSRLERHPLTPRCSLLAKNTGLPTGKPCFFVCAGRYAAADGLSALLSVTPRTG